MLLLIYSVVIQSLLAMPELVNPSVINPCKTPDSDKCCQSRWYNAFKKLYGDGIPLLERKYQKLGSTPIESWNVEIWVNLNSKRTSARTLAISCRDKRPESDMTRGDTLQSSKHVFRLTCDPYSEPELIYDAPVSVPYLDASRGPGLHSTTTKGYCKRNAKRTREEEAKTAEKARQYERRKQSWNAQSSGLSEAGSSDHSRQNLCVDVDAEPGVPSAQFGVTTTSQVLSMIEVPAVDALGRVPEPRLWLDLNSNLPLL